MVSELRTIVFTVLVLIGLSSCSPEDCMNSMGYNDCAVYTSCKVNEDCREGEYCNVDSGLCRQDRCIEEDIDCGEAGKCLVDEHGETTCQCDEGYTSPNGISRCLLNCNSYTDCIGYQIDNRDYPVCSDTVNGGYCNLAVCHGEDSCPEYTCNEEISLCD